jgi:hypothetical protein
MENKLLLEKLLDKSSREEYLKSTESTNYDKSTGITKIRLGEHLEVFDGLVYHHGIYIGLRNEVMTVLDNSNTVGINGKSIQYRLLTEFLGNRQTFNIIKCQCPTNEDEEVFRHDVVKIAELLEECDYATLQQYKLIKWNCECFAWTCSTHG